MPRDKVRWFQIVSWHRLTLTSSYGLPKARCGRWGERSAAMLDDLPSAGKSCETCLKLTARDQKE